MKKKKLLVLTLYADKGSSAQYRAYIFKNDLEKNFSVKWSYFWDNAYVTKYMTNKKNYILQIGIKYLLAIVKRWYLLVFVAPKMEVIFLQRASIPKIRSHFLNKAKKKGVRIVFDVDDAIYLDSRDNSDRIAQISDIVLCGNKTLQSHYNRIGAKAIILPTVDNTYLYEKKWRDTFESKCIGWIGSKFTMQNLELVVNPINRLVEKHPEVEFVVISDSSQGYDTKIKNCHFIKWSQESYIDELSKFTVGIMPLIDNDFNRGKCGFKLIQYLNMRKPVIGSPVGVNEEILSGNGIVAVTEEEWEDALERLLFDENEYKKYQSFIDSNFFEKYHFQKISDQLIKFLAAE